MTKFSELPIESEILRSIYDMGFEEPSPIQAACIPVILEGKDVLGQAQTGTGKTAAFGIPIVQGIQADLPHVQAIILTPTRELAIQVSGELRRISRFLKVKALPIYGGQSIGHQIRALKQGVHVVIGTPGRVLDHLRRGTLKLDQIRYFVLDEADEMLDMGFIDEIEQVIRSTPPTRQTLLFSATMPSEIRRLARRYMRDPVPISIDRGDVTVPTIEQVYYKILEAHKLEALCRIIDSEEVELGIVFCRTKKGVDHLTEVLQERGYLADGLHGDLSQQQRDRVMKLFRENEIELLVATDVAARGIDVSNVSHVINYDIPQDPESYVHRIGRTGRAGKSGIAMTLVTPREMKLLRTIQEHTKQRITPRDLPTLEEVAQKKREQWKSQLITAIEERAINQQSDQPSTDHMPEDSFSYFKALLDELEGRYSLREIALAALYLNYSDEMTHEQLNEYHFEDTGASLGMVRLFINVGRNIDLKPKQLVDAISDVIGIPKQSIGRINIFERFTFVEVKEEVAPFVLEGLKHSNIFGTRINVEPAKPRAGK